MKTVVIYTSADPKGTTAIMLDNFVSALGKTDPLRIFRLAEYDLKPCDGCMKCRSSAACIYGNDAADRIGQEIASCDLLLIGTPCYYANMPGQLKILFDRSVFRFMDTSSSGMPKALLKGKKAVILTACSTPFPFNLIMGQSSGVIRSVRAVLQSAGMHINGIVTCAGAEKNKPIPVRTLKKIRQLARRF